MIENALRKIGLGKNEIKVYLKLFDTGQASAGELARQLSITRRSVYDAIDKLLIKGLVSSGFSAKKKYFQATHPKRLLSILQEEQKEFEQSIPDLLAKFEKKKTAIQTETFFGPEGFKAALDELLEEGINQKAKEWLVLGGSGKGTKVAPFYLFQWFKRLEKSGIKLRAMYIDTVEARQQYKELLEKSKIVNVKWMPKEIKNVVVIHVCGDNTAIVPIIPEIVQETIVFMIKNKETAQAFRNYFEWNWRGIK